MSSESAGRSLRLASTYLDAKLAVIRAGYYPEIRWRPKRIDRLTEPVFLREAAWVVLSSGMRETVIRRKFEAISAAFHNWKSAELIRADSAACEKAALRHFGHLRKIRAIATIATLVAQRGFARLKADLRTDPFETLRGLPYMGPATLRHLAKNIGFDVPKPDRHLIRIAEAARFESVDQLCRAISSIVGDQVSVIDSVLWRYATLRAEYVTDFRHSGDLLPHERH